ncbi:hypothetical protein ACLESO_18865 [Pyxidicoccus sp. 3LG]
MPAGDTKPFPRNDNILTGSTVQTDARRYRTCITSLAVVGAS